MRCWKQNSYLYYKKPNFLVLAEVEVDYYLTEVQCGLIYFLLEEVNLKKIPDYSKTQNM